MNSTNFRSVGSKKRLANGVISQIQNQIIEGKLPPGTKLPSAKKGYKRVLGSLNTDGLLAFADLLCEQKTLLATELAIRRACGCPTKSYEEGEIDW